MKRKIFEAAVFVGFGLLLGLGALRLLGIL